MSAWHLKLVALFELN